MLKPGETCSVGRHRRIVAGMIAALDEGIGNITAAVEKNGLADSITMMFTTVHTHARAHTHTHTHTHNEPS